MKRSTWIYLGSGTLIVTGLGCGACLMLVFIIGLFGSPTVATPPPRIARLPAGPINNASSQTEGQEPAPAGPDQGPDTPVEQSIEQAAVEQAAVEQAAVEQAAVEQAAVEQANEGQVVPAEENSATADPNPAEGAAETDPTPAPVSPTIVNDARMVIANLDRAREYVDLKNIGGAAQDLRGWRLVSSEGKEECPLGGTVGAGVTLRIWAREVDLEQNGYNCGFKDDIWVDQSEDAAILYNANGEVVYQRK